MKPLIYAKKDTHKKAYEETRLRKSIKGSLEANDFAYTTSVFGDYDLVHFINASEINKVSDAKRANLPIVMNALYCETEKRTAMTVLKDRKRVLNKNIKKCLNLADVVLVPGIRAKKFLENSGIVAKLELFPNPINFNRFKLKTTEEKEMFEKYFTEKKDIDFILCVGDYSNKLEMMNLLEIAELCYFAKFYFLGANYSSMVANKYIKEAPKNVVFSSLIQDDVFRCTMIKSKILLVLDARKIEAPSVMEAMAAKTQVLVYNNKNLDDDSLLKDGVNCYIRDGIYDLADCIEKYLKNRIPGTIDKAYECAKNFDLKNSGERLIRIYRYLIQNKKENKFYYD